MGLPYLYGVALAAIIAVLVVMAAAVTLLPALLGFAGRRIDRLRIPGTGRAPADRADAGRALEPRRAAPPVGRRDRRRRGAARRSPRPSTGLRLGFPDAGNDRAATTTPARPTTSSPAASAPAPTARCCSSPTRGRATAPR